MLDSCPEPSKASTSPHRNSFIFRVSNFHAFFGSPVFLNHQNLILPKFHIFEILGCSSPHQILMFPLISHLFEVLEQASSHHHSPTFSRKNHHFPACALPTFDFERRFSRDPPTEALLVAPFHTVAVLHTDSDDTGIPKKPGRKL